LDTKDLKPGQHARAQLRMAEGGLFLPGDRFIIRQFSPLVTLGGGVVLDNLPEKHSALDAGAARLLEVLERGSGAQRLELLLQQYDEVSPAALVARTGRDLPELLTLARPLEAEKRLLVLGAPPALLVHTDRVEALSQRLLALLDRFHKSEPLAPGISKEDLRSRLASGEARTRTGAPSPALFNFILETLQRQGSVETQGEIVRRRGREVQLSQDEAQAKDEISRAFERAGLAVPSARQVVEGTRMERARAEKILQILLRERVLVRVAENLIFHASSLTTLRGLLAVRKAQSNVLSVAAFKEITGLSRKYAIPLLEYLDRERVTRRQGDDRVIL